MQNMVGKLLPQKSAERHGRASMPCAKYIDRYIDLFSLRIDLLPSNGKIQAHRYMAAVATQKFYPSVTFAQVVLVD